jgi:hypothetical protein
MNSFDIFVLIMVVIIIVAIVLINVNSILDKRLSNVAVNIPPINIPSPQITVKVQKSCGSDEYDVFIDNENKGSAEQTVSLSPAVEHFISKDQIINKLDVVKNTVSNVVDALPEKGKQILPIKVDNKIETKIDNEVKINDNIKYAENTPKTHIKFPDDDQIVEYGDYMCVHKNVHNATEKLAERQKSCENQSLIDKKNDAYKHMIKNSADKNDHVFPDCDMREKNNINGSDIEPLEHYRKYQHFVKAYLEDPIMRSHNIDQYQEVSPLFNSGKIPLTDGFKNPKPMGYIFESSPTYYNK